MVPTQDTVMLSRVLVPLLGLVVWSFCYLDARWAYRLPRGGRRLAYQFALLVGGIGIVMLQVKLMQILTPGDAYGNYFFGFIMIECWGGLVVLFTSLFRERARSKRLASATATRIQDH